MLAPNPTNRLHCQHSPTARFESKRAAHQAQWEGVNFGRRSPSSGGQNCTPNNILPAADDLEGTRQADEASSPRPSTARSCVEGPGHTAHAIALNPLALLCEPWLRHKRLRCGG